MVKYLSAKQTRLRAKLGMAAFALGLPAMYYFAGFSFLTGFLTMAGVIGFVVCFFVDQITE